MSAAKTRRIVLFSTLCLAAGLQGCADEESVPGGEATVYGEAGTAPWSGDAAARTFGVLEPGGGVALVGATIPFGMLVDAPLEDAPMGAGPAGAFLVLSFPDEIKDATFFDHLEVHWQPSGHEGTPDLPHIFETPHFDFHFYRASVDEVRAIDPAADPDACGAPPPEARVPVGYALPPAGEAYRAACVPQMGVHAAPSDLTEPFESVMILGYFDEQLQFIEPMITQAELAAKRDVTLLVPMPASLPNPTALPAVFVATYEPSLDVYRMTFSGFRSTTE